MTFYCLPATRPFILNTDGGTIEHCRRAIAWQNEYSADWRIVKKSEEKSCFECIETGDIFEVTKASPYKAEVWQEFLEKLWN